MNDHAKLIALLSEMAQDSLKKRETTDQWLLRLHALKRTINAKIAEDKKR